MFEGIIGGIVSLLANILYIDLKRKGRSGWSRIILFWMGNPMTWLWFFLVREGSAPELEKPPDDTEAILAEIRRDRRLRSARPDRRARELQSADPPGFLERPGGIAENAETGPSPVEDEPEP